MIGGLHMSHQLTISRMSARQIFLKGNEARFIERFHESNSVENLYYQIIFNRFFSEQ